jgi:hypothetical protein
VLGRLASRQGPAGPGTQRADSLLEDSVFKALLPSHGAHSLTEGEPELADGDHRCGVSLNSFAPGGVGTSKTFSVTETKE